MEPEAHDAELLNRFAANCDGAAFEQIVRRHGAMVLGVCRRVLQDHHDAQDSFQAAFLVLARKAKSVRAGASLAAWLHQVALRASLRLRDMRRQRQRHEAEAAAMRDTTTTPDPLWLSIQPMVDEEIAALPRQYREVLVMCCIEGQTYEQAADGLEVSRDAVRGTLARARELLRQRLGKRGITAATAAVSAAMTAHAASADVPAALGQSAVEMACSAHAGAVATSTVATQLAEGVLRTMFIKKLAAACLVGVCASVLLTLCAVVAFAAKPAMPAMPDAAAGVPAIELGAAKPDIHGDPTPPGALARLGSGRFRQPQIRDIGISGDGKLIASCGNREAIVWDAATGRQVATMRGHGDMVCAVAFSPDGKRLATASWDKTVRLWDAQTGKPAGQPLQFPHLAYAVAFSPDGKLLATGSQRMGGPDTLCIWDAATGKRLHALEGDATCTFTVKFSPDGKLLATSGSQSIIQITDAATGKALRRWQAHQAGGTGALAWSPDGKRIASGGGKGDPTVRLWEAQTGERVPGVEFRFGLSVRQLVFHPDGKRLVGSGPDTGDSGGIRLFDLTANQEVSTMPSAGAMALSADGKVLATGLSGVQLRDFDTGKDIHEFAGHSERIRGVAFTAGDLCATAGCDRTVRWWDSTGKALRTLEGARHPLELLSVSPDGKLMATGGSGYVGNAQAKIIEPVRVWDAANGKEITHLNPGYPKISAAIFSSDGKRLLTVAGEYLSGHTLIMWEAATGKQVGDAGKAHKLTARGVALSPDGQRVALGAYGGGIRIMTTKTFADVGTIAGHPGAAGGANDVLALAYSPGGSLLASGAEDSSTNVRLWDTATGKQVFAARHARRVETVAFSPDGALLASGSADRSIRIYDVKAKRCLGALTGHADGVLCVAFSRDGARLMSGGYEGVGYVWDMAPFRKAMTRQVRSGPSGVEEP